MSTGLIAALLASHSFASLIGFLFARYVVFKGWITLNQAELSKIAAEFKLSLAALKSATADAAQVAKTIKS